MRDTSWRPCMWKLLALSLGVMSCRRVEGPKAPQKPPKTPKKHPKMTPPATVVATLLRN